VETLCHDIYPRPITTVSLAANTYCMMEAIAHAHLAPWVPSGSNLAMLVNRAIDDRPGHTVGGHLLSVVQVATSTERL